MLDYGPGIITGKGQLNTGTPPSCRAPRGWLTCTVWALQLFLGVAYHVGILPDYFLFSPVVSNTKEKSCIWLSYWSAVKLSLFIILNRPRVFGKETDGVDRNIISSLQNLSLGLNVFFTSLGLALAIQSQAGGNWKNLFSSNCFGLKDSEFGELTVCLDLPCSFRVFPSVG